MKRLFPWLVGASLVLAACGSDNTGVAAPSATASSPPASVITSAAASKPAAGAPSVAASAPASSAPASALASSTAASAVAPAGSAAAGSAAASGSGPALQTVTNANVKPAGTAIKVGLLTPATGPISDTGKGLQLTYEQAIAAVNDKGGINGVPLQLITYDTNSKPQDAANLLQRLATDDKVMLVFGPQISGEVEVAWPLLKDLKIPAVVVASSKPGLSAAARPWGFRLTMTEDKLAGIAVPKWAQDNNIKKVAIVYDAADATGKDTGTNTDPAAAKAAGLTIANTKDVTFTTTDNDFSGQVTAIKALNPDGVMISSLGQNGGNFVKEMRRQGMKQSVYVSGQSTTEVYLKSAGADGQGTYASDIFLLDDPTPSWQAILTKYTAAAAQKNLPTMEHTDAMAYNSLVMVADLMKQQGVTNKPEDLAADRQKLDDGLGKVTAYPGLQGPVGFNKDGDGVLSVWVVKADNGKFTKVAGPILPKP